MSEMLTMQDLINRFEVAILDENTEYVAIKVQMQGFEKPEIIINQKENFQTKLEYYKKAYDDNLVLKTFSGIKIIGFAYGGSFEQLEHYLMA